MQPDIEREIEKNVRAEDFPDNFQRVVGAVGAKGALQLVKNNGGINQYIPVYDCVTSAARDRMIREEFSSGNYQELAVKYRISESWVRAIIDKDRRQKAREEFKKNQVSLGF